MGSIARFVLAVQVTGVCLAAPPIEIVFDFKTPPEPAVINVMKAEIREILLPAGLNLTLQRLGDAVQSTGRARLPSARPDRGL